MPRPASPQLTDAEQRIMDVLWERGEASVRQLTEALEAAHGLAYTTVLTTVRIMAEKGHVTFRKDGRAHIYAPAVSRSGAQKSALGRLVDNLFSGSPQALAQHLIEDEKLSLDDIEALRAHLIEQQGRKEDGK
ncbi:BlaI/MecI/CopY family transcriptional regulator [Maricaulis sp.]|uniref:BlaI/MecI/CopY family transcriptional regulator n=1 Tax=Maricaulis sp. TaxID=1486257 RepID=UPI00262F4AD2|nr:BlaI/MecI/CopY family transcriptional regulator [Maricaulis sp.]